MAVFQGGGSEKPQLVLGSVLDYFTSALLAYGVAAALYRRERGGVGQYLSLSLLRSALTIQAGRFVWADSEGREVARDSGAGGLTGIHPTRAGALYISVSLQSFLRRALRADRAAGIGERSALRLDAQPGRACRRAAAGIARGACRQDRSRMGGDFRRARALRRGAVDRGHVRATRRCWSRIWSRGSTIRSSGAIAR